MTTTADDSGSSGSSFDLPAVRLPHDAGPLGLLPRLQSREARLASRLARLDLVQGFGPLTDWLVPRLGAPLVFGATDVAWRPSGLRRSGLVVELQWPRLSTRVGFGLATPLAHAVVDRLLGFDRAAEEIRLPITPVEWGILTHVIAECVDRLASGPAGPLGPWDLTIDRVGPDPFSPEGLGRVVTVRWPITLGAAAGAARLWLPEGLVAHWLAAGPIDASADASRVRGASALGGVWRALAGSIDLPRGLKTLRPGGVLPMRGSPLTGTPQSPEGPIALTIDAGEHGGAFRIASEAVPFSGGGRLVAASPVRHEPTTREALPVPPTDPTDADAHAPQGAGDVPVTLAVELGRVNLTLGRLADLKPGDVIELGRHSREPVELTSGGRLVARGELVQVDTELGVRVTHVFL